MPATTDWAGTPWLQQHSVGYFFLKHPVKNSYQANDKTKKTAPIEMDTRVEKTVTAKVSVFLKFAKASFEEQHLRGAAWTILKMEKTDAPSQSPIELPMSLITVTNDILGMLFVTWTVGRKFKITLLETMSALV